MPVSPELKKYVDDARGFGMTDDQIRTELQNSGWSNVDIDSAVGVTKPVPPVIGTQGSVSNISQQVPVNSVQSRPSFNPAVGVVSGMATFNPQPVQSRSYLKWVVIFSLLFILVGGSLGVYFIMPELKDKVVTFVTGKFSTIIKKTSASDKSNEKVKTDDLAPLITNEQMSNQIVPNLPSTEILATTTPVVIKITPEEAWAVYDKYLVALKEKSTTGSVKLLNEVSLMPFKECSKTTIATCKKAAQTALGLANIPDRTIFVNNFSDDKQIILSTNLKQANKSTSLGLEKQIIFFAKDDKGELRFVKKLTETFLQLKTASDAEIKLNAMSIDSDNDGLTDQEETATCPKTSKTCQNTDPNKMDTDGNGYWDSIDKYKNEAPK